MDKVVTSAAKANIIFEEMLCSSICGHYDVEKNAQCGDQPKRLAWHGGGHPQMGKLERSPQFTLYLHEGPIIKTIARI